MIATPKRRPAILGGKPSFPEGLAFVRPDIPPLERVMARLAPSYERGILTKGPLMHSLEERVAARLGVDHVVAVSSCTSGLMLVFQALGLGGGPVVLPSFTFSASAHAVAWNGVTPSFAECNPRTFQLDPDDAAQRLSGAGAMLATHVFGAPCAAEQLAKFADHAGIPLVFDAAHAFGATRAGRPVGGFGAAEVFSLSPTKVLVAGEGGLVTTQDEALADAVRMGRDYGNPGDYDSRFPGLNARLSEFHAAMALASLDELDEHLAHRRQLANRYCAGIAGVAGVRVQEVDHGDESTFKDFTIILDEERYGLSCQALVAALWAEGIDTRRYFFPPVHLHQAYRSETPVDLPVTTDVARRVVSLPIYRSLDGDVIDQVVGVLAALHASADELRSRAWA